MPASRCFWYLGQHGLANVPYLVRLFRAGSVAEQDRRAVILQRQGLTINQELS